MPATPGSTNTEDYGLEWAALETRALPVSQLTIPLTEAKFNNKLTLPTYRAVGCDLTLLFAMMRCA